MILFKSQLNKKEKTSVSILLQELVDTYSDFYITKDNIRLFIRENLDLLFECLKKGDKIAFDENGLMIVTGFSDKANRKYVKFLSKELSDIERLLKVVCWNVKCDLWVKIKKNNPAKDALLKCGFRFQAPRGKEILLVKKFRINKKQGDK